ncbi:MAG: hypothetical protein E7363_01920 [Clostridiales bacterium]|nr:hypothetical protein [Clostridiales bacterium]
MHKRLLRLFALVFGVVLGLISFPFSQAKAMTGLGYVRVINPNVTLYRAPVEHRDYALFYLPETYYLRVIDAQGGFYEVEYQDGENGFPVLYGYVKKDAVSLDYPTPTPPFYEQQTLSVIKACYVYVSPSENGELLATALQGQTVRLYGAYPDKSGENMFYYVRLGHTMGYLPASACTPPLHIPHPDPVITPSVSVSVMPSVGENVPSQVLPVQKTDILKIALILGVCLTVLLALYTAFRPKKPQERYFDEDDF